MDVSTTLSAMNPARPLIEVCVDSVETALAAEAGGAARVELCDNLGEGGTTPGAGAIAAVRERLRIPLHVIIRPRGGDFCYSDAELDVMTRDVAVARQSGADGIVIGVLLSDGRVDVERTRALIALARPLSVTFHRAFDTTRDPFEALESLIDLGVDRILTSGHRPSVIEGLDLIAELVRRAERRIVIMACGGIDARNIVQVARASDVRELHVGQRSVPDPGRVAALIDALHRFS
jgi:copper homeostasis protein